MTADDPIGHAIDPAALLDHSQDLVVVVGADGAVRYANAAVRRVLGHGPEELGHLLDLVHPEDRELADGAVAELLGDDAHGPPVRVRVRHADGSWRWIEVLGDDRRHDPRIGGAVLSGRDVTSVVEAADAESRRRRAEALVARLAARMVAASADDLDDVMGAVLADLGVATGASRSWIFRSDGDRMVRTHRWVAPGAPALEAAVESFAGRELARLLGDARQGTPTVVTPGDLPDGELATAARLADVRSVLVVPLVSHEGPTGLLGVQAEGVEVGWTDDAVHLVGTVGPLVGATLERVTAERALASSEARLRALLRHTSEGVRLLDASFRTTWASPWAESLHGTGHHVADPVERLARIHPDDRDAVVRTRADVLDHPGVPHLVRFRLANPDGTWRHLEEVATNLLHDPDVAGVVVNTRDVTERFRHELELLDQARRDPLTGLPNRRHLHDLLDEALRRADDVLAVVFLDLDRFKLVNDSLGHHVGDALLVEAAARLRGAVRAGDVVARLGGDEFVVMCEGLDAVDELAERVLDAFRRPFRIGAADVYTTASVGVALARPGTDRTEVLRDADAAMYAAKEAGRNQRALFAGHLVERARHRLDLEAGLRRAVEGGELELRWQPIVEDGHRPVGVEALLRWRHPERGLLGPDRFIEVAEDTGLIVPVGAWALREACRWWAVLRRTGEIGDLDLHVNLSVRQLMTPGVADLVAEVLDESGLDPSVLRLEITESALVAGDEAHHDLAGLAELGVRLALDDFGTGYSSLSRLRKLDIDTIKVDRGFVAGVHHDPDDVAIVSAVVELARILRVEVVAEGVETAAQAEGLRALGCRRSQGFLHARPLPLDELRRWLGARGAGERTADGPAVRRYGAASIPGGPRTTNRNDPHLAPRPRRRRRRVARGVRRVVDDPAPPTPSPTAAWPARSPGGATPLSGPWRVAVYAAPPPGSALAAAAAAWLGRDADADAPVPHPPLDGLDRSALAELTHEPRRYGFHATLVAPFRPASGTTVAEIADHLDALAADREPVVVDRVEVDLLGAFAAFVPVGPCPALHGLADSSLRGVDHLRRPLDDDELRRRRRSGLTPRQDELLRRWGYPYVLDELRPHLTLTRRLEPAERPAVLAAARRWFAAHHGAPLVVEDLCLFVQAAPDAPFTVAHRSPLGGGRVAVTGGRGSGG